MASTLDSVWAADQGPLSGRIFVPRLVSEANNENETQEWALRSRRLIWAVRWRETPVPPRSSIPERPVPRVFFSPVRRPPSQSLAPMCRLRRANGTWPTSGAYFRDTPHQRAMCKKVAPASGAYAPAGLGAVRRCRSRAPASEPCAGFGAMRRLRSRAPGSEPAAHPGTVRRSWNRSRCGAA